MTEIFLYIVNMSITATVLAVVVLLLRLLLKKSPKWISVLLWGLVAIRLICPFAVESPFSLMPKTDWVVQEPLAEEDLFFDSVPDSIPAFDASSFGSDVTVQYSYYPLENSDIEIHRGISISFILSCIWAAGMAALLLYTGISTIRLHKSIGAAIRIQDNVWESSAVESPFVLGIIRPRIYVPRGMSEEKMAYVIAHEEAHIRRKDHWWKPLGFLLLTIHWFNPVLWLAYILLCRDIEMACDERVIKEYDDVQRADYSEALLDCSVKRKMITACPLAFGEVSVKERIKSVLNYKKPAFWIVVFAGVACIVTAVCFLTNPLEKTTPADIFNDIKVSEVEWGQVTVWNDERNTVLLSEEQRIELTEILQSIDSSDYEMKNFDSDVTVMLYCGEKEILLHYDNGYVGFTFDSVTAASLENISWVVQNMTLNLFLDTICHTESTESNHVSIPQDSIPAPVSDYENDIIEQAAESILGTVTVYASGIDKLEKIPTATVGISEEILLYRLDYWITKGINGLVGTPSEDIRRETVYFAMFHDWTTDTWTRLGELSEAELDVLYNTAEMLEKYGNKYTAAAAEMGHVYLGDMEEDDVNTSDSEERLFGMYLSYYVDLAWDAALPIAEAENMMIDREYYNYRHDYDGSTIWIQFYGRTESGWDDRYIDITIVREHDGSHKVDPDGCVIGLNSENIKNTMQIAIANGFMDGHENTNQNSASSENASINAVLGSTEGQLIVDNAVVGSSMPQKICEYRYVPVSVTDTMRESLFRAYFGDRADEVFCKDEQKDIWQLGETMSGDFYKYETVSGGQIFTLRYSVPMLNPLDDNRKGYGESSGCTITAEEAVRLCDELIAGMTDPAQYRVDYIHYYGSNGQSPFYWICYKKILEGRTVNAYKDIFFFVDDNGVEEMHGALYDTEVTAEYSEVLSAEQAVEALRKQLDEVNWKEIGISEVSRISLEYITEREVSGWGTWGNDLSSLTIHPIWRMELGKTEEERILNRNRIIGVHAVTGELIQNLTGMGNYN